MVIKCSDGDALVPRQIQELLFFIKKKKSHLLDKIHHPHVPFEVINNLKMQEYLQSKVFETLPLSLLEVQLKSAVRPTLYTHV